jgi:Rhs element Vgr protein
MGVARTIPTAANPDLLTYTIKVDGSEVARTYHIGHISVHKEINKISSARIKIFDGNPSEEKFEISDTETFISGKKIEISLGYHSEETTVFKGIIISHSNKITATSSELVIECKDEAIKMTIGKNSKHFNAVTDSDVAEELIGKYPDVTADVESTSIQHKDLVQFDTTDWDFIVSRMDSIGRICIVNDGTFIIKKPVLSASQKLDVLFGATILEYQAHIDSRAQYKAVQSTSWDFSSQEVIEADGAEPSWTEGGNISNTNLADVIGLEKYKLIHSGKITQEELQAWADARLMKQRLSKIKGTVKYQGNADVLPGDFIGLNGVGNRFNGKAIVNSVHHDCTDGMWSTEVHFGLEPEWFAEKVEIKSPVAQRGLIPSLQGLQIGIVTSLEDPEGEDRVQVKLPVINKDEDGVWARVATLDAGKDRGSFFRPEVDDEVIVGCINNDPSQIIILGMLNSSAKPAPLTASNDNHEKGYVSREKIKMIFNDDEKSYKLETPGGKKITLNDKDGIVQVEDENGNKIKMEQSSVSIESAQALKIKAGTDITIEAVNITLSPSANFSVGAGGGAELKVGSGSASAKAPMVKLEGSGITEIKGGLVKIN